MRNNSEDSCTKEGTGSGNTIFEGEFKLADSEAKKNFDSIYLSVNIEEDRSVYPST